MGSAEGKFSSSSDASEGKDSRQTSLAPRVLYTSKLVLSLLCKSEVSMAANWGPLRRAALLAFLTDCALGDSGLTWVIFEALGSLAAAARVSRCGLARKLLSACF